MRIKKGLILLPAFVLLFSLMTANVEAASTPFEQGDAYKPGAYDSDSMQPSGYNWDRVSRFAAVNSNIKLKWTFEMASGGNSAILLDEDGTLFVKSGTTDIYAINPDGTQKWSYKTTGAITHVSPVIKESKELILTTEGKLKVINKNDGTSYDLASLGNTNYLTEPAIDSDGSLYIVGFSGQVLALNPDGTQKWKSNTGYSTYPSYPTLSKDGTLIFKSGKHLFAFDSATGTKKWEYGEVSSRHGKSSPAIGSDGTIYVTGQEGFIHAVNPDGTLKWKYAVSGTSSSGPSIDPIVGPDGIIYAVNGSKDFYALNPDGTLKWSYPMTYGVISSPIIDSNGLIYLGDTNGNFMVLDSEGKQKWGIKLGGTLSSAPVIAEDGTIYIANGNGTVFAIGGTVEDLDPSDPTEPPVDPVGERAILVITLNTGVEKEYDLSMKEVQQFINWYEGKAAGSGTITFAINKHENNKGPFKQRQDYIVFDKIVTFEVNEY